MRKYEFGKIIAVISSVTSILLTLIVIYMTFCEIECSNLTTIAVTAWAETAASNVAYYGKSKKENLPKVVMGIYKGLPRNLKEQIDINQLMQSLLS